MEKIISQQVLLCLVLYHLKTQRNLHIHLMNILLVDIPRKNPTEQFDFRVEFYDINNNFIPIKVEQSVPFRKGNTSRILSTAVNVSASGVSDAGDILSVNSGVVQIANTNIQTSTISNIEGFGNPTVFSQSVDTTTTTLNTQTTDLAVSSSEFASSTDSLNNFTESFNTAISLNSDDVTIKGDLTVQRYINCLRYNHT